MKPDLYIMSTTCGSIGEITKDLKEYLQNDFNIVDNPTNDCILFSHLVQNELTDKNFLSQFKTKILLQHLDGVELTSSFIQQMKEYDLVIVPTEVAKNILIKNKVNVKIKVIPLYFIESDVENKKISSNKICFYHESYGSENRKGVLNMCTSFNEAFKGIEDVELIVKTKLTNYDLGDKISFINKLISKDELKVLWNKCDVYTSFAMIEGFGMPLLRMHLMGKRIVIIENEYSGYNDFLSGDSIYKIESSFNNIINVFNYYKKTDNSLALENREDAIKKLLKAYTDQKNKIEIKPVSEEFKQKHLLKNVYEEYKKSFLDEYFINRTQ